MGSWDAILLGTFSDPVSDTEQQGSLTSSLLCPRGQQRPFLGDAGCLWCKQEIAASRGLWGAVKRWGWLTDTVCLPYCFPLSLSLSSQLHVEME